jgi:preprotein translocase subunit SecG
MRCTIDYGVNYVEENLDLVTSTRLLLLSRAYVLLFFFWFVLYIYLYIFRAFLTKNTPHERQDKHLPFT